MLTSGWVRPTEKVTTVLGSQAVSPERESGKTAVGRTSHCVVQEWIADLTSTRDEAAAAGESRSGWSGRDIQIQRALYIGLRINVFSLTTQGS